MMKKFVFLYYGFEPLTEELKETWGKWFQSIGDKMVDGGNPFATGREITHKGIQELPLGKESITGYSIINAGSLDEAEEIARGCPIIMGIRVYETTSM
jgi:hypothetical protein